METMKEYVIRRAKEVRRYRQVADANPGVEYEWLTKLAQGRIKNPGADSVEKLFHYYKALEGNASKPARVRVRSVTAKPPSTARKSRPSVPGRRKAATVSARR